MGLPQEVRQSYLALAGGNGVGIRTYPTAAAGVTCTGGAAYGYQGANAGVKALAAAGAVKNAAGVAAAWRLVWLQGTAPSALDIYIIQAGSGTGAGTAIARYMEVRADITVAKGPVPHIPVLWAPTIAVDGVNDALLAQIAAAAGASTLDIAAGVMFGMGS